MYAYVCLSVLCICVNVCVSVPMCLCIIVYLCICLCVHMCVCVNACVCLHVYIWVNVCLCVLCVCLGLCVSKETAKWAARGVMAELWSEGGPGDPGDRLKPPQRHIAPQDLRKEARKGNELARGPRSCWPKHTCALLHLLQNAGPGPRQHVLLVGQPL